jgi:hypothetical protein
MKENIRLLDFLRSNRFILYVAIFTVIFLAPNTYYVFYSFSVFISPYREIASAGVSGIVAASIMIYTLRKNFQVAKYYSLFEISISAYYYITMIGWDWGLIPAISFTLMLPVSVYHYTKEIDVGVDYDNQEMQKWLEINPNKRPTDYYKEIIKLRT